MDTKDSGEPDISTWTICVAVGWTNAMVGGGGRNGGSLGKSVGAVVGTGTDVTVELLAVGTAVVVGIGCARGDCDTAVDSGVAMRVWTVGASSVTVGRGTSSLVQATTTIAAIAASIPKNLTLPIYPL